MYLMLLITAANCGSSQQNNSNNPDSETTSEAPEVQDDVLVGTIERSDLEKAPHTAWFDPMYQAYNPEKEALKTIQEHINDYEIRLFMGTWCADSQFEVPKFYKILDLSNFDLDKLEVTAVREDKTLPNDGQKEFNITYVPTIIFFKDGQEIGRFVEYAQEDLEKDIAKIVSGQEYTPAYE